MNTRSDTVRVFVAVGLSVEAREQLVGAVDRIRQQAPEGIQWADPTGMHLTLKFMGNIPSEDVAPLLDCLKPVAADHPPFALELAGLGMFPNRHKPRVLWAGVGGDLDALSRLQRDAEEAITALGHPSEERPFRPHITLGRPRRTVSDTYRSRVGAVVSGLTPPAAVGWTVDSVEVMQSELHPSGARYSVLGSVHLKSLLPQGECF